MAAINWEHDGWVEDIEAYWNDPECFENPEKMKAPMSETPFRLMDLPKEVRRKVLYYSNLVVPANQDHGVEDIEIHYNTSKQRFLVKRCQVWGFEPLRFPGALFSVSKDIREEALDVLFRYNRIALCCSFAHDLRWLERFPRHLLQRVRKLDLVLDIKKMLWWKYDKDMDSILPALMELLFFIKDNFNLENLVLSIDYQNQKVAGDLGVSSLPASLIKYIAHYVRLILRPNLHRFLMFAYHDPNVETLVEKHVMGLDFDSHSIGKLPKQLRGRGLSHKMSLDAALFGGLLYRMYPEEDGQGPVRKLQPADKQPKLP